MTTVDDRRYAHLRHAFEMLLKGALADKKVRGFDNRSGRSVASRSALRWAAKHLGHRARRTSAVARR